MLGKVLLVEDEKKTGEMLKLALESENISVDLASTGEEALNIFEKGKFDLIVLDLKLPVMSGDEVLEQIRKIDPYVEVVVYTNNQEPHIMKKLINLGVDSYLNKGYKADLWEMVKIVKEKLDPFTLSEISALLRETPADFFKKKDEDK